MAGLGVLVSIGAWIDLDRLPGTWLAVFWIVSLDLATTVHIQAIVTALLLYEYMTPNRINSLQHLSGSRYGTQPGSQQLSTVVQAHDIGANLTEKRIVQAFHSTPPYTRNSRAIHLYTLSPTVLNQN
jgi:hypothetical protein